MQQTQLCCSIETVSQPGWKISTAEQAVIDLQETPRGTLKAAVASAFGEDFVAPAYFKRYGNPNNSHSLLGTLEIGRFGADGRNFFVTSGVDAKSLD